MPYLICLLLLLGILTFLFFSKLQKSSLTHNDLLTLLDQLQYKHEGGVCNGFTLIWAQESAMGLEEKFYDRLSLIDREKGTLVKRLDCISQKIKAGCILSVEEEEISEIPPFLEAVCLAQLPENYYDIYNQSISQSNINAIYNITRPSRIHNGKVSQHILNKTFTLRDQQAVHSFLQTLASIITNEVMVVCNSEEHTVGFRKFEKDIWLFIDINTLFKQKKQRPYQLLTTDELSFTLYHSLFESSARLIINCTFVSSIEQKKLSQQLHTLYDLYPVYINDIDGNNCRDITPLVIAVQNGDVPTVQATIRLARHNKIAITQSTLHDALFYASACNQVYILEYLLTSMAIDINIRCGDMKESILSIACDYNNMDVVRFLLQQPNIRVNLPNIAGMTPLMQACKSDKTKNNVLLFQMLLAAGADISLTNAQGKTAYILAYEHNNAAALQVINDYMADNRTRSSKSAWVDHRHTWQSERQKPISFQGFHSGFTRCRPLPHNDFGKEESKGASLR